MVTVFLDVDGTVSPLGLTDAEFAAGWGDWTQVPEVDFELMVSPSMGARLAGLGALLVWTTTWGDNANVSIGPRLGFPPLPVAARRPSKGWWKLDAVAGFVGRNPGPFVWVDDDLDPAVAEFAGEALGWAARLNVAHLFVAPVGAAALTVEQMTEIEQFCRAQQ